MAAWFQGVLARTTLYTRSLALGTLAIMAALAFATVSQAVVNHRLDVQIQQVQAVNARLRTDIGLTTRRAAWAADPATIEDEARASGYMRPGEHAVLIVSDAAGPTSATPARAPAMPSRSASGRQERTWWQILFGG